MRMSQTGDLWWKTAVLYCADVQTFYDSDSDGIGDLRGMTEKIEYLADLGITCLWLMPIYPSPSKDDGYDITDFYGVDPRLGTHGDFVELVRTARAHGIKVILDFVMNHTSDQHPWFRSARRSVDAPYRDFFVWASKPPRTNPKDVVFPDQEDSLWELDPKTGEYYLHHFYKHQPDLNVTNPAVQEEIARTIGFWLELGVAGFRVDAVPFLISPDHVPSAKGQVPFDPKRYLADVRRYVSRRSGNAMLLGEVNLPYREQKSYFGGSTGDGLHMQFDFMAMQSMYLSLAREDARPLEQTLRRRPVLDVTSQWANFVRNHDELTLDKLTREEREEVFAAFGPEPDMQLFDRGLRRRLPPMLGGDERRLRLVYSLMFSLPGTPVLFYGEEIGLAENLDVPGRLAVRTPMQWADEVGGGFTKASARRQTRPFPEGLYSPQHVNVGDQRHDHDSLWWFMRNLIRMRKQTPQLGWAQIEVLRTRPRGVFAHVAREGDWLMLALHNFAPESVLVDVALGSVPAGSVLIDLLGGRAETPVPKTGDLELEVDGFGHRWLLLHSPGSRLPT